MRWFKPTERAPQEGEVIYLVYRYRSSYSDGKKVKWGKWEVTAGESWFTYNPYPTEAAGWFEDGFWVEPPAHEVELLYWAPIHLPIERANYGLTPENAPLAYA